VQDVFDGLFSYEATFLSMVNLFSVFVNPILEHASDDKISAHLIPRCDQSRVYLRMYFIIL